MPKKITIYHILLFLLILLMGILFYYYNHKYEHKLKSSSWVDTNLYPEAKLIFDQKHIIKDEVMNILDSNLWGIWSCDYRTTPQFTKMKYEEIIDRLNKSMGKIGSTKNKSAWRLFGLILNKKKLDTANFCPKTIDILTKSSNRILNAGFSLMEPKCYLGRHKDYNHSFYRLHIPIIIPKNNNKNPGTILNKNESNKSFAVLNVEDDYIIWKDNEYFMFDDTYYHNAWNNTNELRIVLLIDILK